METATPEGGEVVVLAVNDKSYFQPDLKECLPLGAYCGHNVKYEILRMLEAGIDISSYQFYDTMLLAYLLNRPFLALNALALYDLGTSIQTRKDVERLEDLPSLAQSHVETCRKLFNLYTEKLLSPTLYPLYHLERELIPVTALMEQRGIRIERQFFEIYATKLISQLAETEKQIYKLAGMQFNIKSNKQLGEVLASAVNKSELMRTSTSQIAVHEKALTGLARKGLKLAELVLHYSGLEKLMSTYVIPFMEVTGDRVYSNFRQFGGTATGRFSSSKFNLQNIPKDARAGFLPEEREFWLKFDYNQIELRVAAYLSKDERMEEDLEKDIHAVNAERFGVDRKLAKAIAFGTLYGQAASSLAFSLNIPRLNAYAHQKLFFNRYYKLSCWREKMWKQAQTKGEVTSLMGKRYQFPPVLTSFLRNAVINYIIQGSAAEVCKMGMLKVYQELGLVPSLQVHDELLYSSSDPSLLPEITAQLNASCPYFKTPVEAKVLARWE